MNCGAFGAAVVRLAPQRCVWRRNGTFGAAAVRLAPQRCVWRRNGAFGALPLSPL